MAKTMMRTKPRIRAEQALIYWQRPRCTLTLDAAMVRAVPAKLAIPAGDGMESPIDEMVGYEAVFATEDPWMMRLWSYDREAQNYAARWTKLNLSLAKENGFGAAQHVCWRARSVESLVVRRAGGGGAWSRWQRRAAPCPARSFCRGRR